MGNVAAPVLTGLFVELATWRLFFAMNIVIILAAVTVGARLIPADQPDKDAQQVDTAGTAMLALTIGALFCALARPFRRRGAVGRAHPK